MPRQNPKAKSLPVITYNFFASTSLSRTPDTDPVTSWIIIDGGKRKILAGFMFRFVIKFFLLLKHTQKGTTEMEISIDIDSILMTEKLMRGLMLISL